MGVNISFFYRYAQKKNNKKNNKQQTTKNSETFKEGNAAVISGYLSAVHFIQVGLS